MNSQNPGIYLKNGNFGLEMSFEILGIRPIYDRIQTTVVTEPPPEKPLIPKESAFNMIYGTLVGIALFVVIVILCWMLSTKLERDKQRKKREEIVSPFFRG